MLKADVLLTVKSYNEAHRLPIPYGKGNDVLVKLIEEMTGLGYELVDATVNLRDADGAKITIDINDGEWNE